MSFNLICWLALIVAFTWNNGNVTAIKLRPIHIGLSIDDHSLKDLIILINSVVESALEPSELVFHIVACGKDLMSAMVLKKSIASSLNACLPDVKHELVAFMLPAESGFALQLGHLKKKSNHWNSQSGADMVRFFMPSLFSHVDRILYLDNDIIVSCCLEEVYDTPFEEHQIIGIALDSLNWATVTQFQRHYNASHPLVVKNMRRLPLDKQHQKTIHDSYSKKEKSDTEISTKEFSAMLPRCPNDGVLLIDVKKYNERNILETMNEIAQKNGEGEYVVNLGTQQFTVLALWDRWKELTPRANLRHFPDMARGYLMWFYYNGFLHYAGQHKPKQLCLTTTMENAQNRVPYLRVMSYTAWALSNYQVHLHCPHDHVASVPDCLPHVHQAVTLTDLYSVLHRIISVSPDPSLLHVHVGPLYGNYSVEAYRASSVYHMPVYTGPTYNQTKAKISTKSTSSKKKSKDQKKTEDMVDTFVRTVLHNATWSVRVFDFKSSRVEHSSGLLLQAGFSLFDPSAPKVSAGKKKGKKEITPRTIAVLTKHLCDSSASPYKSQESSNITSAAAAIAEDRTPSEKKVPQCQGLLAEIKAEGRAHWDAQVLTIDVNPPHSFFSQHSSTNSAGSSDVAKKGALSSSEASSSASIFKHSSLGVLLHLDLVFMRPKIILVRLAASSSKGLAADVTTADRFLRPNGYLTSQHTGAECGESRLVRIPSNSNTAENTGHSNEKTGSATTPALSHSTTQTHSATVHFACVWGLRVNEFEFYPNLLT